MTPTEYFAQRSEDNFELTDGEKNIILAASKGHGEISPDRMRQICAAFMVLYNKHRMISRHLAEVETILADLSGPRCQSCGSPFDPTVCHCGTMESQHRWDDHSFVPYGCICLYSDDPEMDRRKNKNLRETIRVLMSAFPRRDEAAQINCKLSAVPFNKETVYRYLSRLMECHRSMFSW